jgi:hypothetical protein
MARIREQREGARKEAADNFREHEGAGKKHSVKHASLTVRVIRRERMMAVIVAHDYSAKAAIEASGHCGEP